VLLGGNTLTLNLALSFAPSFAGTKNIYTYGANVSANSGWQARGTWTVPAVAAAVTADSATPNAGSGVSQTFVMKYSDTTGAVNLAQAWVYINPTLTNTANACFLYYDKASNQVNLIDDTGTNWTSFPLGIIGTLQNSVCSLSLAGS